MHVHVISRMQGDKGKDGEAGADGQRGPDGPAGDKVTSHQHRLHAYQIDY